MNPQVLAKVLVHWLAPEQGGRKIPPSGPVYAATGQFAGQGDDLFSVVLRFPPKKTSQMPSVVEAELGFLASELVEKRLAPGTKLLITEGPRKVAECEIQSVIPERCG